MQLLGLDIMILNLQCEASSLCFQNRPYRNLYIVICSILANMIMATVNFGWKNLNSQFNLFDHYNEFWVQQVTSIPPSQGHNSKEFLLDCKASWIYTIFSTPLTEAANIRLLLILILLNLSAHVTLSFRILLKTYQDYSQPNLTYYVIWLK